MSLLVLEMATLFHWIRRRFIGIIVGLGSILVSTVSAGYIFHWMHSDWGMGVEGGGGLRILDLMTCTSGTPLRVIQVACNGASTACYLWSLVIFSSVGSVTAQGYSICLLPAAHWSVLCVSPLICGILFKWTALIWYITFGDRTTNWTARVSKFDSWQESGIFFCTLRSPAWPRKQRVLTGYFPVYKATQALS